ncbi:hypothetical protein ABFV47_24825 [Mycolicibacterium fortuitum]
MTAEQEQRPDPAWSGGEKASSVLGLSPGTSESVESTACSADTFTPGP